jgi:hypothetical protein
MVDGKVRKVLTLTDAHKVGGVSPWDERSAVGDIG